MIGLRLLVAILSHDPIRRYGELILVAQHSHSDHPRCFIWRGSTYRVLALLATWHLQGRWWKPISAGDTDAFKPFEDQESDRHYFRLDCSPGLLCGLNFDVAADRWILAQAHTSGSGGVTREAAASLLSWEIFGAGCEWSSGQRLRPVEDWARDVVDILVGGVARVVALPAEEPAPRGKAAGGVATR